MFVAGFMIEMDQSARTQVYVSDRKEDLALYGNEFDWFQTCFSIAYAIFIIPSQMLQTGPRPSLWRSFAEIIWGVLDNSFNGPIGVLDVIDLRSHRCNDAEVVSSALHGPEKIGVGVNSLQFAICSNNVHRFELIYNQTVMALKPAMTTSQCGSEAADALTCSSDSLLARCLEGVSNVLAVGATADGH